MNVQTFEASSIHAALSEARQRLGDDVVLLESMPPRNGEPARIKVLCDRPIPTTAPSRPAPAAAARPQPAAIGFGYGAARRPGTAPTPSADASGFAERFSALVGGEASPDPYPPRAARPDAQPRPQPPARPRGRLFEASQAAPPAPPPPTSSEVMERMLEAQMGKLHARIEELERRSGDAIIGASQRWAAHPLFGELLQQGLQPGTAARLFEALTARGFDPDADPEELRWGLAQELRRRLDVAAPKTTTGTLLFIGPSGSGKTSLVLRLALHPNFFGRRRTTVIVVQPEDEADEPLHDPVSVYQRFGIPVQAVRTEEEMARALARVERFDQILIDTPPLPSKPAAARKMAVRLARLVGGVVPLQTHLVLNATRSLDAFDPATLRRLPVAPAAVALTHLDETDGWGRIAEWLLRLELPVPFAATAARVPDGLVAFSPAWFVEEMMQL